MNLNTRILETNKSHLKNMNKIKILDDKYKKINNISNYYRYLKKPNKVTDYAYVTIIFNDNKYIPGILNLGYNLKYNIKTSYNLICLVQDKPYYENNAIKFNGLTENEIEDIKKIYDVVIGIDILKTSQQKVYNKEYTNISYYCTKLLCLGLVEYKKLIFMDASIYINKNIDYFFKKYNESSYYLAFSHERTNRGLPGNFFLFIPKKYYILKGIYIAENYNNLFGNDYSYFTPDEDVLFYTIFPNWSKTILSQTEQLVYNNPKPRIQMDVNDDYLIYCYIRIKPFRYPLLPNFEERFLFNNYYSFYNKWDLVVKVLIKTFPEFKKYYDFIKTYRYTDF